MRYVPALDGLRAVAVLMVLAFHAQAPFALGGYVGVDLFFVLSGYLITSLLLAERERTGTINLPAFYLRRARRLYPALLFMLAVVIPLAGIVYPLRNHWLDGLLAATYLTDYAPLWIGSSPVVSHTWSLSIEEQFYLLWPLVILLAKRPLPALVVLYVAGTLWRFMAGAEWVDAYLRFDTHFTGLVLGAILACVPIKAPRSLFFIGFAGMLALCVTTYWRDPNHAALLLAIEGFAAMMVVGASTQGWLAWRSVVWIGQLSYGIYLWHYPLMKFVRADWPWWQTLAVMGTASVLLAWLSYVTVERWSRSARRREREVGLVVVGIENASRGAG